MGVLLYIYLGPILIRQNNVALDDVGVVDTTIVATTNTNEADIGGEKIQEGTYDEESLLARVRRTARSKTTPVPVVISTPVSIPATPTTTSPATTAAATLKSILIGSDTFSTVYTVKEAGSMLESTNQNWWVSSGAYLYSSGGVGSTIRGALSAIDPWRVAFYLSNSLDTDGGYYPQNIFRLVLKSTWLNYKQEAYFKIINDNLSVSPNRNASNGLLLFNRYQDAFNLYYTGVRVDGYAVIKKKINGEYFTLAYKPIGTPTVYNRDTNPNQLPKNTWIGLKSEVKTNSDGTVSIKLYMDKGRTGVWVLVAEAMDDGKSFGGGALLKEGYAGIRTDFMDVEFDDYFGVKI